MPVPSKKLPPKRIGKFGASQPPDRTTRITTPLQLDHILLRTHPSLRDNLLNALRPILPFEPQPFRTCETCGLGTSDANIWKRHSHEEKPHPKLARWDAKQKAWTSDPPEPPSTPA